MDMNIKKLETIALLTLLVGGGSVANAGNDDSSQSPTVYVAGKGKFCKEAAVSGYLDCFYASMDACEKHNKSADLRCVANPHAGT